MNLTVKKAIQIQDGLHTGAIIAVEYRTTPHDYTDIVIEFEGIRLKAGYPTTMMKESQLGQLMTRFGFQVSERLMVDPDDLIGKIVSFMTLKTPGKNGKIYSNIIKESVKPSTEQLPPKVQTKEQQAQVADDFNKKQS